MIPRIQTGTSFIGAGLYYLHDKREKGEDERLTKERVTWTHAMNTMEDEPEAVLAEMRRTVRNQGLLKQLSGSRSDGRPTRDTVMTVSLAWSPEQEPGREEMIEAGNSFLNHMGWDGHQVLFVAHDDTKHPHVHLIINRIHPETGMTLDANWSKRRAQKWALEYEREHGQVYCKARETRYDHDRPRKDHMNYREWKNWQDLIKDNAIDPEFQQAVAAGEWDALKQAQKQERVGFWKETSRIRREIRQELREQVREEFKEEWQAYAAFREDNREEARAYNAKARETIRRHRESGNLKAIAKTRESQDDWHKENRAQLAAMRKDISERQKARFEEIAVPTLEDFKKERTDEYQKVLARHRAERTKLAGDQEEGTRRRDLLGRAHVPPEPVPKQDASGREPSPDDAETPLTGKAAANYEFYSNRRQQSRERDSGKDGFDPQAEKPPRRDGFDLTAGAGLSLVGKISESLETLFDTPPPSPADQQEKQAMEQERENWPAPHPNVVQQRVQEEEAEQEAKRKADLEFFQKRREERGFYRDR